MIEVFNENNKRYGTRRIKKVLNREGQCISRRRIGNILKANNLQCVWRNKQPKVRKAKSSGENAPNILEQKFSGYALHTHVCSDLTYAKVGRNWCYVCLLIDLANREIAGHAAAGNKSAKLVKSAFATLEFPISDIEVFHTDRGTEFCNAEISEMLEVFEVEHSLSKKGCPYDNAVIESTNKILKEEFIYQETFSSLYELQVKLSEYVHWYNHERLHSTLEYMSPVEFRKAGLSL